jgi:GT2 family glycosyltransferase
MWIRLSRRYSFDHIRQVTCAFSHRLDGSTMTGGNPFHFLASYRQVCYKHRRFPEEKPWILRQQKQVEWNFICAGYEYVEQQTAPLLTAAADTAGLLLHSLQDNGITKAQIAAAACRMSAMQVVGNDQKKMQLLREALQHDQEYLTARLELVRLLLQHRQLPEACGHLELLLALKPDDPDLSGALADCRCALAEQTQKGIGPAGLRCSIIIPLFNRLDLTQPCIESVMQHTPADQYELIVVDNGSTDGTADYLATLDGVTVVSNRDNAGFARACNQGARAARSDKLLFLNNDTVVHEGWLQMLLDCLEQHPEAGILGCRLLYPDGTVQHAGVAITVDGIVEHLFSGFSADHPAVTQPRSLQAVTAACMLVQRTCFESVGGFDEGYSNGFEDVDFCLKARSRGYDVRYSPDTRIVHYEESSPGRNLHESYNKLRFRQRWQNEIKPDFATMYEAAGLIRPIGCDEADDAYQCYGHRNGALFMYLQIIEKFPDDAGAYLNIARILLQYRRFDDAREFVEKALRIAPYFKQAQELKMRCNKMV